MRRCSGRCRRGWRDGRRFRSRFGDGWRRTWPSWTGSCRAARRCERLAVEGGWYAVLRIPALEPDEQTVLALLERGVWVHPGYFFGMPESGWLVVSLLGDGGGIQYRMVTVTNYFRTNQQGNF